MSHRRKAPAGAIPAKLKAALAAKKAANGTTSSSSSTSSETTTITNSDPIIYPMTTTNINNFQGTPKENQNVSQAVNIFNSNTKQYKKALKFVDTNLKKNGLHFNSLVVKALLLVKLEQPLDAKACMDKALSKVPGSTKKKINFNIITAMGCHLVSSYYKEIDDYEENYVWLQRAYEAGGGFQNQTQLPMLNQLCLLAAQLRKYPELLEYRQNYLHGKAGYRANWSGLAVALDLNNQKKEAIAKLTQFEEAAAGKLGEKEAYEHSECTMYKNDLLFKMAKMDHKLLREVLKHLFDNENVIEDKLSYWERIAEVYVKLGDFEEASKIFRKLIKKNPDNFKYFKMLELTLGIKNDVTKKTKMYSNLLKMYPSSEPCRFMPLTFIEEESKLKEYLIFYLDLYWSKGVLATFQLLKPLFKNIKKTQIFQQLLEDICLERLEKNEDKKIEPIVIYLLSNLYLFQRRYNKSLEMIEKCIQLDSINDNKILEFELFKARILKHMDKLGDACTILETVRNKDLSDRFLNNKAVKYNLRNNDIDEAVDLITMFTKNDASFAVNGIPDLHSLQCNWFIVEQAESYRRLYETSLAEFIKSETHSDKMTIGKKMIEYRNLSIKRFEAVLNIYKIYKDDQYDFNSYCLRRGTVRQLLDLVKWVDKIHTLPIYKRTLNGLFELSLTFNKFNEATKEFQSKLFLVNHKPNDIKKIISYSPEADADPFGDKYNSITTETDFIKKIVKKAFDNYSVEISKKKRDYILSFILEYKLNNLQLLKNLVKDYRDMITNINCYDDLVFNPTTAKLMESLIELLEKKKDEEEKEEDRSKDIIESLTKQYVIEDNIMSHYQNKLLIDYSL